MLPLLFLVVVLTSAHATPVLADDAPAKADNDPYPEALRRRIDAAVDKAVDALRTTQAEDGTFEVPAIHVEHRPGVQALMTLALLVGGTPPDALCIRNALRGLRTTALHKTYDVAVLMMALHARYAGPEGTGFVTEGAYGGDDRKDPCASKMSKEDKALMKKCLAFLLKHEEDGHWRYPGDGVDLSNTQYALLGLHAAAQCGFEVPEKVWMRCLTWLLATQEKTGRSVDLVMNEDHGRYRVTWKERARARGFRYRPENPVTGAMTTAGLASLAICQTHLWASRRFKPALRARSRKAIRDALAWLQKHFAVDRNPGEREGGWHFYYLYGLERAGVLSRMRFFGDKDWYLEGATWLLGSQEASGKWQREHTLLDTAFAILFLKRSTYRLRRPVITPPATER